MGEKKKNSLPPRSGSAPREKSSPRHAALSLLTRIEHEGSYSNLLLDAYFQKAGLPRRDEAFVTALIYGVLEEQIRLDYLLSRCAGRDMAKVQPKLRNLLRLGAYQLMFMSRVPAPAAVDEQVRLAKASGFGYAAGFVNAVLRRFAAQAKDPEYPDPEADRSLYLSVRYSLPRPLVDAWRRDYAWADPEALMAATREKPPVTARVNTVKTTPCELTELMRGEGISAAPHPSLPDCLVLDAAPDLRSLASFQRGLFILQDAASQLCCEALGARPGETVADLCAAPGGKSFTTGFLMRGEGRIRSFDMYEARVHLIAEGAARLGLALIEPACADASHPVEAAGMADRVLCDVPCSGLGVIRRKPEIIYKNPEMFDDLPQLQYSILSEGARHVKTGGRLCYSTCTLRPEENERVAARFLGDHPAFAPGALPPTLAQRRGARGNCVTLFPHTDGTDGFFIAVFEKRG